MEAVDEPSLMDTVTGAPPAPPGWIWWFTHQPKPPARGAHRAVQGEGQAHHDQLGLDVAHEVGHRRPVDVGVAAALEDGSGGGDRSTGVADGHADAPTPQVEADDSHLDSGGEVGR